MKPIKLQPVFKDYIWGGNKLRNEYNKATDMYPLAESWELSCHPNGLSKLEDNTDITLLDYIKNSTEDVLGDNCKKFDTFPLLLKLIDAKGKLSLQVHPDDEYAQRNENQFGKTEAWYVLSAEKDAEIIYGLKHDIDQGEIKERIKNNTILDVVNRVKVQPGDLFFIEPGTLHGIGAGIVIAEIQQSSDVTYRVYDYDRRDANGNPRDLHVDKACDVIKYRDKPTDCKKPSIQKDGYAETFLSQCDYFTFKKYEISSQMSLNIGKDSFTTLLCIDGECQIECNSETLNMKKGETIFCPAGDYQAFLSGSCTLLEVKI